MKAGGITYMYKKEVTAHGAQVPSRIMPELRSAELAMASPEIPSMALHVGDRRLLGILVKIL